MTRLWITGFRSFELGIFGNQDPKVTVIKFALEKLLKRALDEGLEWVITGGQLGIDQYALETANALRLDNPLLKTALMTPFIDFGGQWNENNQAQLQQLKTAVDFTQSVSPEPYKNPQQFKNYQNFMLKHTDGVILFYDPQADESKVRFLYADMQQYQQNRSYPITLVDFDRLQEYSDEYAESIREW
ncbi:DUF1273 domain-containing protein [Weissella koreensis]|uniref:DUF1273 domain-containing protein n=1 Tax=Weissella koreensis TaxID=165096 RepID=A0A7H1MN69_9LACO|nr:DUF1273 domain-containing protein [Weissella koreensis]AVH75703.1 hypothetical protein C4597_06735 [Weissella koreensis]QGN20924.1 DUF1273 family protein [Weissella koreensis]QNT64905.1 DUF1273 domain-containing protein [Weissella koreensis]